MSRIEDACCQQEGSSPPATKKRVFSERKEKRGGEVSRRLRQELVRVNAQERRANHSGKKKKGRGEITDEGASRDLFREKLRTESSRRGRGGVSRKKEEPASAARRSTVSLPPGMNLPSDLGNLFSGAARKRA